MSPSSQHQFYDRVLLKELVLYMKSNVKSVSSNARCSILHDLVVVRACASNSMVGRLIDIFGVVLMFLALSLALFRTLWSSGCSHFYRDLSTAAAYNFI